MKDLMRTFWADESGQDLAEYGLLLVLIAVAVVAVVVAFRESITGAFTRATGVLNTGA